MSSTQIRLLSKYVLRNPAYPINYFLGLLDNYSVDKLDHYYSDDFLKEALFIASPELKSILDKWLDKKEFFSSDKSEALEFTLLKYIARISSRCTPFGLFSGCSVGTFADDTLIILDEKEEYTRTTQFDMHYWISLLQEFAKKKEVREYLVYSPNNSLYSIGDYYRYVEYKYIKTKREHSISAIRKSDVVEKLLIESINGISIQKMLELVIDDESDTDEALEFIHQLIDYQILTSNLEASLTSESELNRIIEIIEPIPVLKKEKKLLIELSEIIKQLDALVISNNNYYTILKSKLDELGLPFDEKYLFQVDMNSVTKSNQMDWDLSQKVRSALVFLNGLQRESNSNGLSHFKKAFIQRYESRELQLTFVLDTEIGIGYNQKNKMDDTNDILYQFDFNSGDSKNRAQESWSELEYILEGKLKEFDKANNAEIILLETDFKNYAPNLENLPPTFSVMCEVFKKNNEQFVSIESVGNVSAAKLLGRFCTVNEPIHEVTKAIIKIEKTFFEDKILAEIVHIPEARTGNILRRPVLREYEIPYLCNSVVDKEFQIEISDLMVSVKNDRVVLRSKKHNKEVVPFLSNAHNYSANSLPIYHFLADLQSQGLKPIHGFSWGTLANHYSYFPRVLFNGVILTKAKWIIKPNEIQKFYEFEKDLFEAFSLWKVERGLPKLVNLVEGDNTLLLDLGKEIGIKLFLDSVKKAESILLEEFLFTDEGIVKDVDGNRYANQVILSFYKEKID